MAVVQISRIQVRRGKATSGTGLPQLASGEMAWALDTQELYIGNGSVAEGAPAVGNTRVLTEVDLGATGGIINSLKYIYKEGSAIQTGPTINEAIERTFQSRFDDVVNGLNFNVVGDEDTDVTEALQRAVNQLFLNTSISKSSINTADGVNTRVTLMLSPGIYTITGTIFIPSYTTIVGAGADKTIIKHTGASPMFRFVNDSSTSGAPATLASTTAISRPKNVMLKGMTFETTTANQTVLKLDAAKDCVFDDLIIKGAWGGTYDANSQGINMSAVSSLITCENNIFKNVTITGFSYGVWAKQDILNNSFYNCIITDTRQGFVLGQGANGATVGEQYGPRKTVISNSKFDDVKQHGVLIERGTSNVVSESKFINVGCNGGTNTVAVYPQVFFSEFGNSYENNFSDRQTDLSGVVNSAMPYSSVRYIPELAGYGNYKSFSTRKISLSQPLNGSYALTFRLPVSTNSSGDPQKSITYTINYLYRATNLSYIRSGTITVVVDVAHGTSQLSDEFNVANITSENAVKFDFRATLLTTTGMTCAPGETPYSIAIEHKNEITGDSAGEFSYSYTSTF